MMIPLLGNLVTTNDGYNRAVDRPFIALMQPLDEDEVSWDYVDLKLSELSVAENDFDHRRGSWRLRCMFHEDDWHEARHSTLTSFLGDLAVDSGSGVVFAYSPHVECSVWHLREGRAQLVEVAASAFPSEVRDLLATEAWHQATNAMLAWCTGQRK